MNKSTFLAKATEHLISNGKSIRLINKLQVTCDGVKTSGYYDGKTVVVAVGDPEWFDTFIHEYCHFLQELDEDYDVDEEDWADYDEWLLHKKELTPEKVKSLTESIRNNELDCERRVVELIEKHNLPMDIGEYIQCANTYALFYTLATKYRTWYTKCGPYSVPGLINMMPKTFRKQWNRVPKDFEKLVKEQCFNLA